MSFMNVLVGPNAECIERVDATETKQQAAKSTTGFAEFEARWRTWLIGFSHFVSIESPTQLSVATLWLMLARRAAGIFQRDENRADLFIPIFTRGDGARSEARVSVLLVHVKSPDVREASDYPFEAESELDPRSVFVSSSDLHTSELGDILRLYVDVTTSAAPRRFWFKEATACTSFGACLSGLAGGFGSISFAVIPILRSLVTPQAD